MADESKVKQRIELDGEKEYNAALKEAQRNLRTLRSELKAESAELGKNATEQQKAEVKTKNLQKQIKEQEKVVKTYKDALEEVKEKYGENADVVAKYEQKLNDARATLANMKNSIDDVGQGLQGVKENIDMNTVATKSLADAFKGIGDTAGTISGALESAFSAVYSTIHDMIANLWDEVVQVAAKANSWTDLADYFGTTAANVQKWSNAIKGAGGSFDSFTSVLNKFKTGGVNKKIAEYFGVSDAKYTDDVEYTVAVLRAMVDKREKMEKAGTWDKALKEIFGSKKSQEAGWFISNWSTIEDNLSRYDANNGGVGMTTEELETMNQLYIDVQNIQTTWEAFKDSFLAGAFGKLSLDLVGNAQGILDAFMKYFNAENDAERESALAELEKNIVEAFERIKKAIEDGIKVLDKVAEDLKNSDNPTSQAIGNLLSGFVDALQWLTEDNMNNVVKALEVLAAFWITGKGLAMGTRIASIVKDIAVIKGFSGGGAAAGAGASSGVVSGGSGAGAGIGWGGVGGLGGLAAIAAGFVWAADRRNNHPEDVRGTDENLEANVKDEGLKDAFIDYVEAERALQEFLNSGMFTGDNGTELFENVEKTKEAFQSIEGAAELLQAYSDWRQEHSYGNMDWELPADWWQSSGAQGLTSEDISGFKSVPGLMRAAVREGVSNIKVVIDGQTVGNLVAPYVSEQIARDMA